MMPFIKIAAADFHSALRTINQTLHSNLNAATIFFSSLFYDFLAMDIS